MSTKLKSLARKTSNAAGNLALIDRPFVDHRFRVDMLLIKLAVVITNSNAGAQVLDSRTFGHNWRVNAKFADGQDWYKDVPLTAVEMIADQTFKNYLTKPNQLVKPSDDDSTAVINTPILAGAAPYAATPITDLARSFQKEIRDRACTLGVGVTTTVNIRLVLPLARPNAANPTDFSQSLSLLGALDIKVTGDTGNANLTVTSFAAEVIAIGRQVDNFYAGIRQQHFIQGSVAPTATDSVALNEGRLLALHRYSTDAASPCAGTTPHVELDNGVVLVDLNDVGQVETDLNELACIVAGSFPADAERQKNDAVLLVAEPFNASIFDIPQSGTVTMKYGSNASTAGKQFIVVTQAVAKKDACRVALYPGARNLTPAELDAATRVLGRTTMTQEALRLRKDWLPEEVLTNEARGAACG